MVPRKYALWSSDALSDMESIWSFYLHSVGPDTAEKIIREINEVVGVLSEYPLVGHTRNEVRRGLRSLIASPHIIFYRLVNNAPEIVRVLDGRQDIEESFSKK